MKRMWVMGIVAAVLGGCGDDAASSDAFRCKFEIGEATEVTGVAATVGSTGSVAVRSQTARIAIVEVGGAPTLRTEIVGGSTLAPPATGATSADVLTRVESAFDGKTAKSGVQVQTGFVKTADGPLSWTCIWR